MNNQAILVKLRNVRKHPNADKLQLATILGTTVVVGIDNKEGDLGIYFDSNLQLSEEYCFNNNLSSNKENNKDKEKAGFIGGNRRIRAIRLRGELSNGLFMPLSSVNYLKGLSSSIIEENGEGFEFDSDGNSEICRKYIVPIKQSSTTQGKQRSKKVTEDRIISNQFRFHFDTAQLARNLHHIFPEQIGSLSWKFHGTSSITSNCLVKRKLSFIERFINNSKILNKYLKIQEHEYDYIFASRKVIKNGEMGVEHNHFYGYDLWADAGKKFDMLLHQGETVYYEIVGFLNNGKYIQGDFDYKCNPGEYKIYVYRITQTTPNGCVIELQWNQLKERCNEIGFELVPEIFYGQLKDLGETASKYYSKNFGMTKFDLSQWRILLLQDLKEAYLEKESIFCNNKVPEEGIVLRIDSKEIKCFKYKADLFWAYEDKQKEAEVVDIEDEN